MNNLNPSLILSLLTVVILSGFNVKAGTEPKSDSVPFADLQVVEACREVRNLLQLERQHLREIQLKIGDERQQLRQQAETIQRLIRENKEVILLRERETESYTAKIEDLQASKHEMNRQLDDLWESVQVNLREFSSLYSRAFPERTRLKDLIASSSSTQENQDELTVVLDEAIGYYWDYFAKASAIERYEADVFNEAGQHVKARLLTAGLMGGSYWNGDDSGIVYFEPGSNQLRLLSKGLNRKQRRLLRNSKNQAAGVLPIILDVSDGTALRQVKTVKSWNEFFESGGIIMYPLAIIGVIAFLMIIERGIYYISVNVSNKRLRLQVFPMIQDKKLDEALEVIDAHIGPGRRFWRRGIALVRDRTVNIDEAIQHLILSEIPVLERFLGSLAVFAAICPLLGLLGTVSGMIKTFQLITIYGTGEAGMLSQGISEALITTQVGLTLAIPILLAHAILARHSKTIINNMDQHATEIIETIAGSAPTPVK